MQFVKVALEIGFPLKFHWYVLPLIAGILRVTLPPEQNVVGPLALITGIDGNALTTKATDWLEIVIEVGVESATLCKV